MNCTLRNIYVLVFLAGIPTQAMAVEFVVVGPRAAGMGGAGVAVTTDSLATYWNPAGLAMTQTVDSRVQASGQAIDRLEVRATLDAIENFTPPNPAGAQALADRINGGTLSGLAAGGLYFKGRLGAHAVGFNVSDVATSGAFVDPSNKFVEVGGDLQGAFLLRGFEARQAAFSYAYAFWEKTLAIGITAKIIQGAAAYTGSVSVVGGQDVTMSDNFGKAKLSTDFGIDAGAIYRPSSWLRVGVVAKDINQPEFDAPDGSKFKLNPQVRGGVAVNPYSSLTLTADMYVTSNKTFVPGVKSQVLSLGAEQTFLSQFLSLRVGTFKNVQDA